MKPRSSGGAKPAGVPPEYSSARPCRMPLTASVATMGDSPSAATASPLTSPIRPPTSNTAASAPGMAASMPCVMPANRMPDRPMVQGSDRSSPPVRITAPCPSARMARKLDSTISAFQ